MQELAAFFILPATGMCTRGTGELPQIREHIIATDLRGGYQVVAADLNKEGQTDLFALASNMPELVWFENPGWERHVIVGNRSGMINPAVMETDSQPVIDDSFIDGHELVVADLKHDGRDEIIAGCRGKGGSVYIYTAADESGSRWTRHDLDKGGISAASCVVVDLNGDGKPDIACIGPATANLKWYENR